MKTTGDWGREKESPPRFRPPALSFARLSRNLEQARGTVVYFLNVFLFFIVRGENGPGGWAFREAEDNPNRTEYVWLFDVDLKVM